MKRYAGQVALNRGLPARGDSHHHLCMPAVIVSRVEQLDGIRNCTRSGRRIPQ